MKKCFVFSFALLTFVTACSQKEVIYNDPSTNGDVYIQATAGEDGDVDDASKAILSTGTAFFRWAEGDQIAVYTTDGYKISNPLSSAGDAQVNVTFSFSGANGQAFAQADRQFFALYPAALAYDSNQMLYGSGDISENSIKINLPAVYNLSEINVEASPVPMIAANTSNQSLAFKNLCALLRFTLKSVPKQTSYITFDFNGKKVQGEFTISNIDLSAITSENPLGFAGVQTSNTTGSDDRIRVNNDGVFDTFQTELIINIFVPAGGEYNDVTVTTYDSGNHKINSLVTPIRSNGESWTATRKSARRRTVNLPVFAIDGTNAIGNGTKVVFAPGNLQAEIGTVPVYNSIVGSASSWHFASKQYEALGDKTAPNSTHSCNSLRCTTSGYDIDLFAWIGRSETFEYADNEKYGILFPSYSSDPRTDGKGNLPWVGNVMDETLKYDWGHNTISDEVGLYPADVWRTLTAAEWAKVMYNRSCTYIRATVKENGTPVGYGVIITPDQYTHPAGVAAFNNTNKTNGACSDNVYSVADWVKLEAAGCVFIPLTNLRNKGSQSQTVYPGDAWYWSINSADNSAGNGKGFGFNDINVGASLISASGNAMSNKTTGRLNGCAVRLVRVVN